MAVFSPVDFEASSFTETGAFGEQHRTKNYFGHFLLLSYAQQSIHLCRLALLLALLNNYERLRKVCTQTFRRIMYPAAV